MSAGAVLRSITAAVLGAGLGAAATLAMQSAEPAGRGEPPERQREGDRGAAVQEPAAEPVRPTTFLAWIPGELPSDFRVRASSIEDVRHVVVVANHTAWLDGSFSAEGEVVDDPPKPYAIPLDVSAVDPAEFAPFVPPADRGMVLGLQRGQGILGASSARLRGLGPGAVLRFGDVVVEVVAVLPDELVGAAELVVTRETGALIGVFRERYALLRTERPMRSDQLKRMLGVALPAGEPVQVRAPGETPYLRQGDAVLPPVLIKLEFGEFAARPAPGRPGFLQIDPRWVRTHIATRRLPLLGQVTCNRELIHPMRGALEEIQERGFADTIDSYSGCFAPRLVNRVPTATISHHSWGIAFDVNVPQNPYGARPDQHPKLVEIFERWGFVWGGRFLVPDGMHFEYRRPPALA